MSSSLNWFYVGSCQFVICTINVLMGRREKQKLINATLVAENEKINCVPKYFKHTNVTTRNLKTRNVEKHYLLNWPTLYPKTTSFSPYIWWVISGAKLKDSSFKSDSFSTNLNTKLYNFSSFKYYYFYLSFQFIYNFFLFLIKDNFEMFNKNKNVGCFYHNINSEAEGNGSCAVVIIFDADN